MPSARPPTSTRVTLPCVPSFHRSSGEPRRICRSDKGGLWRITVPFRSSSSPLQPAARMAPWHDQPCRRDLARRGPDARLTNDAQEQVRLLAAEARAGDGKIDSVGYGVFCCFLDARTDPDEMDRPALGDDRPLECAVLQEIRPYLA